MLKRKFRRDFKNNFGQFSSVGVLIMLAVMIYCVFSGNVASMRKARNAFEEKCNLSQLWCYSEGFTDENLEAVRELDFVDSAQLRTGLSGTAPEQDGAQVDIYLVSEDTVNKTYLISGEAFDPDDTDGVWLTNAFAEKRNIGVGDEFTFDCSGISVTKTVKGLIESCEYEFRQADNDTDIFLEDIAFVFMGYDAFPIRDYLETAIEKGDITAEDIADSSEVSDALSELGIDVSQVDSDMLLTILDNISDDELSGLIPRTQLVIRTTDGKALEYEDEIADAIDNNYSAMIDKDSVAGLARVDSELEQHEAFSVAFLVIFLGIAILMIATSMRRIVDQQRTQIGTLNALGMKKSRITLHYISFALVVSVIGGIIGLLVGWLALEPIMVDIFGAMYVIPGTKASFFPSFVLLMLVCIAICTLTSFLSCRRLLKVKPAEALRPAPPKSGKRCIFEKLPFWKKLGFISQYNLRDMSRSKMRTAMCIVGGLAGAVLAFYGFGCTQAASFMVDLAYNKTQTAEYQLIFSDGTAQDTAFELADETDGQLMMSDEIELSKTANATTDNKYKCNITVLDEGTLYNLLDNDNNPIEFNCEGFGVSRKAAERLGIEVGDTVYWHIYDKNEWHEATVDIIYHSNETQGIACLRDTYLESGEEYTPTYLYSSTSLDEYEDEDFAAAITTKQELKDALMNAYALVNILIGFMGIMSVLMIVVVFYNCGSISFSERIKEFATLKVLGLQSKQIRRILSIQNVWLSAVGIIIGLPIGKMALNWMINSNGEDFDYNYTVDWYFYVLAAVFVLIVSALVGFMFSKRIKNLDLAEALKGAE